MDKISPIEMRKMLELVESMKQGGIGFVPIPYSSEKEKNALLIMLQNRVEKIEKLCECAV